MSPQGLPSDMASGWGCLSLRPSSVDERLLASKRWHGTGAVFILPLEAAKSPVALSSVRNPTLFPSASFSFISLRLTYCYAMYTAVSMPVLAL